MRVLHCCLTYICGTVGNRSIVFDGYLLSIGQSDVQLVSIASLNVCHMESYNRIASIFPAAASCRSVLSLLSLSLLSLRLLSLCVLSSCSLFSLPDGGSGGDSGTAGISGLRLGFDREAVVETKAVAENIDTNSFILELKDSQDNVIYSGRYGDSPEQFDLPPGSYTVRAVSSDFRTPAFASPQYGDEQCVVVPAGEVIGVRLNCTLMNCGICLNVDSGFLTQYPKSSLFVKSDEGRLPYSYTEKRIAYFLPGKISLLMLDYNGSRTLLTRSLSAGDVLKLAVKVSGLASSAGQEPAEGIRIAVDTAKNWIDGTCIIGGSSGDSSDGSSGDSSGGGSSESDAMTISMAKDCVGETDVWVGGYIVGGDLTSANAGFTPPFKSRTNILLGPRSSVTSRDNCLSVQLPEGDARDALNLVDNPELLGRQVLLCGDIVESYYGLVGIKNISDFTIK